MALRQTVVAHDKTPDLEVVLTKRQIAIERLSRIHGSVENQKRLMLEAWEAGDAKELGYATWEEYADKEFGFSRRHFYTCLTIARGERIVEQSDVRLNSDRIAPGQWNSIMVELMRLCSKDTTQIPAVLKEAHDAAPHVAQRGMASAHNGQITVELVKAIVESRNKHRVDNVVDVVGVQEDVDDYPVESQKAPTRQIPVEPGPGSQHKAAPASPPHDSLFPDTPVYESRQTSSKQDNTESRSVILRAMSCQRDDQAKALLVCAQTDTGDLVSIWLPYVLLPRDFQP